MRMYIHTWQSVHGTCNNVPYVEFYYNVSEMYSPLALLLDAIRLSEHFRSKCVLCVRHIIRVDMYIHTYRERERDVYIHVRTHTYTHVHTHTHTESHKHCHHELCIFQKFPTASAYV